MALEIGSRVSVGGEKQGTVQFIGETDFASGNWVGVELDKPEGKNDGSVNGKRYFQCKSNYGLFVKKTQARLIQEKKTPNTPSPATAATSSKQSSPESTSTAPATTASSATLSKTSERLKQLREKRAAALNKIGDGSKAKLNVSDSSKPSEASSSPAGTTRRLRPPSTSPGVSQLSSPSTRTIKPPTEPYSARSTPKQSTTSTSESSVEKLEKEAQPRQQKVEKEEKAKATLTRQSTVAADEEMKKKFEQQLAEQEAAYNEEVESLKESQLLRTQELEAKVEGLNSKLTLQQAELEVYQKRHSELAAKEQEQNDLIAKTNAKTTTALRQVEEYQEQIQELKDMLEMMTLDAETLKMDNEIAEERIEELQQQVTTMEANQSTSAATSPGSFMSEEGQPQDLVDENEKLKSAIKVLHQRGIDEKAQLAREVRLLETRLKETQGFQEKYHQVREQYDKADKERKELKEMLDVANAYENMIETLTEKNLELGDQVNDLKISIHSLETLKEMSEEMEEQHVEYEKDLQQQIASKDSELSDLTAEFNKAKDIIRDHERTFSQFRQLVLDNQNEIQQLRQQLSKESTQVQSMQTKASAALHENYSLKTSATQLRHQELRHEFALHQTQEQQILINHYRNFIPSELLEATTEQAFIVRQKLIRIRLKTNLLAKQVERKLGGGSDAASSFENLYEDLDKRNSAIQLLQYLWKVDEKALNHLFELDTYSAGLSSTQDAEISISYDEKYQNIIAAYERERYSQAEFHVDRLLNILAEEGALVMSNESVKQDFEFFKTSALCQWYDYEDSPIPLRCVSGIIDQFLVLVRGIRFTVLVFREAVSKMSEGADSIIQEFDYCLQRLDVLDSTGAKLHEHLEQNSSDIELSVVEAPEKLPELVVCIQQLPSLYELVISHVEKSTPLHSYLIQATSHAAQEATNENSEVDRDSIEEVRSCLHNSVGMQLEKFSSRLKVLTEEIVENDLVCVKQEAKSLESSLWNKLACVTRTRLQTNLQNNAKLEELMKEKTRLVLDMADLNKSNRNLKLIHQKQSVEISNLSAKKSKLQEEYSLMTTRLKEERERFDETLQSLHDAKDQLANENHKLKKQAVLTGGGTPRSPTAKDVESEARTPPRGGPSKDTRASPEYELLLRAFRESRKTLATLRGEFFRYRMTQLLPLRREQAPQDNDDDLIQLTSKLNRLTQQLSSSLTMPKLVDLRPKSKNLKPASAHQQRLGQVLAQKKMFAEYQSLKQRIEDLYYSKYPHRVSPTSFQETYYKNPAAAAVLSPKAMGQIHFHRPEKEKTSNPVMLNQDQVQYLQRLFSI